MSTERCNHGKRVATRADLNRYSNRPECVIRGDCNCHACSEVCWEGECYGQPRSSSAATIAATRYVLAVAEMCAKAEGYDNLEHSWWELDVAPVIESLARKLR
jgi:hypothetical protein